jgi:hypothetical protein
MQATAGLARPGNRGAHSCRWCCAPLARRSRPWSGERADSTRFTAPDAPTRQGLQRRTRRLDRVYSAGRADSTGLTAPDAPTRQGRALPWAATPRANATHGRTRGPHPASAGARWLHPFWALATRRSLGIVGHRTSCSVSRRPPDDPSVVKGRRPASVAGRSAPRAASRRPAARPARGRCR